MQFSLSVACVTMRMQAARHLLDFRLWDAESASSLRRECARSRQKQRARRGLLLSKLTHSATVNSNSTINNKTIKIFQHNYIQVLVAMFRFPCILRNRKTTLVRSMFLPSIVRAVDDRRVAYVGLTVKISSLCIGICTHCCNIHIVCVPMRLLSLLLVSNEKVCCVQQKTHKGHRKGEI